jgi:glycosyltransferase involved in cell wall biosynthesis
VRTPAAEEVCGDASELVADDADAVAAALERVLCDASLRARLTERGLERARAFTWELSAGALRQAYREALARVPGR